MSVSTSIPKTAERRRPHAAAAVVAIMAAVVLAFGAIATRTVHAGTHSVRSGAPTQASVLRSLTPSERRYVLGIASLTPLQLWAAFGTSPTPPATVRR